MRNRASVTRDRSVGALKMRIVCTVHRTITVQEQSEAGTLRGSPHRPEGCSMRQLLLSLALLSGQVAYLNKVRSV